MAGSLQPLLVMTPTGFSGSQHHWGMVCNPSSDFYQLCCALPLSSSVCSTVRRICLDTKPYIASLFQVPSTVATISKSFMAICPFHSWVPAHFLTCSPSSSLFSVFSSSWPESRFYLPQMIWRLIKILFLWSVICQIPLSTSSRLSLRNPIFKEKKNCQVDSPRTPTSNIWSNTSQSLST